MTAMRLLADLLGPEYVPGPLVKHTAPPANRAKDANRKRRRRLPGDPAAANDCERTRTGAVPDPGFAEIRTPPHASGWAEGEERRGSSQDSQVSQRCGAMDPLAPALTNWTGDAIARFVRRRDRLQRWGWAEADAEALAERLAQRDREGDSRRVCFECEHYVPGHCANHKRAQLATQEVGRSLATMLQRCPGFSQPNARAREEAEL
jgi:hypothetical protein